MEIIVSLVLVFIGAAACYSILWYTEFKPVNNRINDSNEFMNSPAPEFVIIKNTGEIRFSTLKPGIINNRKYR